MAIIAGMETATVDDVKPFELPVDAIAKGIMAKQSKYDEAQNEITDRFKELDMELRDRQEDWDAFNAVKQQMADDLKNLEESAGGDWSQIPKSEISKVAMTHAQSDVIRQLTTAREQAKMFEKIQREKQAAGASLYHFGVDPLNQKLVDEDGVYSDFKAWELIDNIDPYPAIDQLSKDLGDTLREDVGWDSMYKHMSKEQRDSLWYDYYTRLKITDADNAGQITAVIEGAFQSAMANKSVSNWHKKMIQDYQRSNPDASPEEAVEYANHEVQNAIFHSSKKKLSIKHQEELTPYFNTKPAASGGGSGGGKGTGSGPTEYKDNAMLSSTKITTNGASYMGHGSPGFAAQYITDATVNMNSLPKPPEDIGEINNINILKQFTFAVPLLGPEGQVIKKSGSSSMDVAGKLYTTAQNYFLGAKDSPDAWLQNPSVVSIDNSTLSSVQKLVGDAMMSGKELSINDIISATADMRIAGRNVGGLPKTSDYVNSGLMYYANYKEIQAKLGEGATHETIHNLVKEQMDGIMSNYDASGVNRNHVSFYGFTEDADGKNRRIGVDPAFEALKRFYDNTDPSSMSASHKQVFVREKEKFYKKYAKAKELEASPEFAAVSGTVIAQETSLKLKASSLQTADNALRLNSGLGEDEYLTTAGDALSKQKGKGKVSDAEKRRDMTDGQLAFTASMMIAIAKATGTSAHGTVGSTSVDKRVEIWKTAFDDHPARMATLTDLYSSIQSGELMATSEFKNVIKTSLDALSSGPLTDEDAAYAAYFNSSSMTGFVGKIKEWTSQPIGISPAYTVISELWRGLRQAGGERQTQNLWTDMAGDKFLKSIDAESMAELVRRNGNKHLRPQDVLNSLYTYLTEQTSIAPNKKFGSSDQKVAKLAYYYGEILAACYNGTKSVVEHQNLVQGWGIGGAKFGGSPGFYKMKEKIKSGNFDLDAVMRNKLNTIPDSAAAVSSELSSVLQESKFLTVKGKKHYEAVAESMKNRESKVAIYYCSSQTIPGKQALDDIASKALTYIQDFGNSADDPKRAIFGESLEENVSMQEFKDIYDQKALAGDLKDGISFSKFLEQHMNILGISYDMMHNANSPYTIMADISIPGHSAYRIQIPLPNGVDELNASTLTQIGWPEIYSKHGKKASQSLKSNGNLFFDMEIEGEGGGTIRVHRAVTTMKSFAEDGSDIQPGQFYIIGNGDPAFAASSNKGKAQVFDSSFKVFEYVERNKSYGKYGADIMDLRSIILEARIQKNPDAWIQSKIGKRPGATLQALEKQYEELIEKATGGSASKK